MFLYDRDLYDRFRANPPKEWQSLADGAKSSSDLYGIAGDVEQEAIGLILMANYLEARASGENHLMATSMANYYAGQAAQAVGRIWKEVSL